MTRLMVECILLILEINVWNIENACQVENLYLPLKGDGTPSIIYMRKLHEPQHFYVVIWQNWNFRSSKEDPRQTLFKWCFKCFQNIGLGAEGFEASKRLRTLFMVSRILTKNGSLQLTFKGFNIYKVILILQILVLPNLYFKDM